ncbi:glycosyltransferase family 4 protein [Streptomyces ficellus]|uniref:D-inositol 3-phosphate glycosyltransferase n=1 Tax=Streptomyces ficellus TaxID=1977088 RepID=A0A6I6F526_9ACTN|nr:glycosyltransferase family 4 protein [Streptomyces ficellus]QGV78001.1 glycosyltransferase family 1 protein [Streptomyces ficellus]
MNARPRTGAVPAPPARPHRRHVVVSVYDDVTDGHYNGGGAAVIGKVADRLAEEFDITVVTAGRHSGTRTAGAVHYRTLPVRRAGPRAGQLLFQALLPLVARRLPHDLWLESFTPPFSTSFLPLVTRAPVVGIDQGRTGEAMWRKYHLPFFLVERLGLRCYRDLVVMNAADAATVGRLSPRARVRTIPNGVDPRPAEDQHPGEGTHILCLGRVDTRQKGLDLLLAAYARARPGLPLVLAGNGTAGEEKRLDALLARHGDGVHRTGRVSGAAKERLLRDSAFVVLPSRNETFGLSALEGMSFGKPVLHFALPTLAWMRDGGGVPVPPFDVDALADRIRALAADRPWRARLGRQAADTARHYTWDRMTDSYLALARALLVPRRPPARRAREEATRPWAPTARGHPPGTPTT